MQLRYNLAQALWGFKAFQTPLIMHVIMNTAAAWLTILFYLAYASRRWRALLHKLDARIGDGSVALLLLPLLLATGLRPHPVILLKVALYLLIPTLLLRWRPKNARAADRCHVLTVLAIWLPLETSLFALPFAWIPGVDVGHWLGYLALPDFSATLLSGVTLPLAKLTGILLALHLFLIRHPLAGIGFDFRLRLRDVGLALAGLAAFALVGIPLGLAMGFLKIKVVVPDLPTLLAMIIAGYLLIALAEELLFRGIIQNLLGRRWGHPLIALLISALIFGASHLNNATTGFAQPNWAYMLMATLAGLAYGWVWRRTGRVTASALTHMLVNLMWGVFFA